MDIITSPGVLAVLSVASIVMFVGSLLGIPWIVARLPEDYFCKHRQRTSFWHFEDPRTRVALKVLRNLLGVILLLAGIAMLALPGQGIITIVVAVALLDIPGKRHLLARIAARAPIARTLNKIRLRHGQPPLEFDWE